MLPFVVNKDVNICFHIHPVHTCTSIHSSASTVSISNFHWSVTWHLQPRGQCSNLRRSAQVITGNSQWYQMADRAVSKQHASFRVAGGRSLGGCR